MGYKYLYLFFWKNTNFIKRRNPNTRTFLQDAETKKEKKPNTMKRQQKPTQERKRTNDDETSNLRKYPLGLLHQFAQ